MSVVDSTRMIENLRKRFNLIPSGNPTFLYKDIIPVVIANEQTVDYVVESGDVNHAAVLGWFALFEVPDGYRDQVLYGRVYRTGVNQTISRFGVSDDLTNYVTLQEWSAGQTDCFAMLTDAILDQEMSFGAYCNGGAGVDTWHYDLLIKRLEVI